MDYVKTFLLIDGNNPDKAHHIKITANFQVFYNQSILYPADSKRKIGGWHDFYQDENVTGLGNHGYQTYIDKAVNEFHARLNLGDLFDHWANQGDREAEVIAVDDKQALVVYTMPRGRMFLVAVDRYSKKKIHSVSPNNIPAKWALSACLMMLLPKLKA